MQIPYKLKFTGRSKSASILEKTLKSWNIIVLKQACTLLFLLAVPSIQPSIWSTKICILKFLAYERTFSFISILSIEIFWFLFEINQRKTTWFSLSKSFPVTSWLCLYHELLGLANISLYFSPRSRWHSFVHRISKKHPCLKGLFRFIWSPCSQLPTVLHSIFVLASYSTSYLVTARIIFLKFQTV